MKPALREFGPDGRLLPEPKPAPPVLPRARAYYSGRTSLIAISRASPISPRSHARIMALSAIDLRIPLEVK